jgi:hypothetical protein
MIVTLKGTIAMELRHLRYFLAIVAERHKAAKERPPAFFARFRPKLSRT